MLLPEERKLIFTLAFINFSHIVDFMLMMPLGPQVMRVFAVGPDQFGLLVSAYSFTAGVSGILLSSLMDRFDKRSSLLALYTGFMLGTLFCGLAPTFGWLLFFRSLTGFFGGVLNSVVYSIVSDKIAVNKRGYAMGLLTVSFSAASIFGVPLSIYIAAQSSWRWPFIGLGFVGLLLWLIIYFFVPKTQVFDTDRWDPLRPLREALRDANQRWSLLFIGVLIFSQFVLISFFSPSLVANVGVSEAGLTWVYLVGGGISIFSSPFFGRMSDRYGRKKILQYAIPISLIPIYFVSHLSSVAMPLVLLCTVVFFVSMGARMVPSMAMVSSAVAPNKRGGFMSILSSMQSLGAGLAAYVAGNIVVRTAEGRLENYSTVGWVSAGASLVALFLAFRVRDVETQ